MARKFAPFCGHHLSGSALLDHYRAYFSQEYGQLKDAIARTLKEIQTLRTAGLTHLERSLRHAAQTRQFWSQFCEVPNIALDTQVIEQAWNAMVDGLEDVVSAKQASPLDQVSISEDTRHRIQEYEKHKRTVEELNEELVACNSRIDTFKQQTASASPGSIASEVAHLKATKARHNSDIAILCETYLAEVKAKEATETRRAEVRTDLDQYRNQAFPASEETINEYLSRFNAGFRVGSMRPTMTRGGATCTYGVVINETTVPVGINPGEGEHAFGNTLSGGDRNTLALAMFLASVDADPDIGDKIVVIDDPLSVWMTSVESLRHKRFVV